MKSLLKNASARILIVSDQQSLERNIKPLKSLIPLLRKRGVEMIVYGPYDKRIAKKLSGATYIHYKTDSSFAIIDNSHVLFMISSSGVVPEYEVAIWMESPFFVQALSLLFEAAAPKRQ